VSRWIRDQGRCPDQSAEAQDHRGEQASGEHTGRSSPIASTLRRTLQRAGTRLPHRRTGTGRPSAPAARARQSRPKRSRSLREPSSLRHRREARDQNCRGRLAASAGGDEVRRLRRCGWVAARCRGSSFAASGAPKARSARCQSRTRAATQVVDTTGTNGARDSSATSATRPRTTPLDELQAHQLWMIPFVSRPDAVSSASPQPPEGLAPRTREDALPSP
jgi:hypothetical protein